MNNNNSNTKKSNSNAQNPSSNSMLHSIANVATNQPCSSRNANQAQIPSAIQETALSTSRSVHRSTKRRRKHTKKAPVSYDETNSEII